MIEKIEAAPFDEVGAGELHDLADSLLVGTAIALCFAFLAHRLRVMGAAKAFSDPVSQEVRAGPAKDDIFVQERRHLVERRRKPFPSAIGVVLLAEDTNESNQNVNVFFFSLGQLQKPRPLETGVAITLLAY